MDNTGERLERLIRLHRDGELTTEEFLAASRALSPNTGETGEASDPPSGAVSKDEAIRAKLREYKTHEQGNCVTCGYEGLLGVAGVERPWWGRGWGLVGLVIVILLLVPAHPLAPVLFGAIGGYAIRLNSTTIHDCPKCAVSSAALRPEHPNEGSAPTVQGPHDSSTQDLEWQPRSFSEQATLTKVVFFVLLGSLGLVLVAVTVEFIEFVIRLLT